LDFSVFIKRNDIELSLSKVGIVHKYDETSQKLLWELEREEIGRK
jgi:hypothetical protein